MLTCLNSSHLERTRHLMQYTYQDVFLLLKTVFELVNFDACSTAVFCFTSSTSAKCFPLRTLFIRGHTQKVTQGEIGWIGRVGHRGHAVFLIKNCWKCGVGKCPRESPVMKWANALKESSERFTEAERSLSPQRQLMHWYRWVPRTLT